MVTSLALVSGCAAGLDSNGEEQLPEMASSQDALGGLNAAGENLGGANLGGSNLGGTNLGGANLGGTNLGGTNLGGANLGGTNLGGNNLGGANLGGTNLGGANLGGTNLGGANLGGTNLGGSNLGGSNLAGAFGGLGCPISGTSRLGADLTLSTVATDIHNLGAAAANKLLRSGEDIYSRQSACVVMGLGSTAFAKLVSQNLAGGTMYAAVRQTSWGFSQAANGPIALSAWEVVVWGSARYSVFIVAAPPATTWAGVAGFVKAIFRWNAPPSLTLKIGQIGGGQTVQTHTGMMNAQAQVLGGIIDETTYVGGQLAFAAATTNNVSVMVDFASWVGKKVTNNPLVLGRPDANVNRPDAVYSVVRLDNGEIGALASEFSSGSSDFTIPYEAWLVGGMGKPTAKRCFGAVLLNKRYPAYYPSPTDKCDTFALNSLKTPYFITSFVPKEKWSTDPTSPESDMLYETNDGIPNYVIGVPYGQLGCTQSSPGFVSDYQTSRWHCRMPVLSQTYVHLLESPYTVSGGEGAYLSRVTSRVKGTLNSPVIVSVDVTNVGTVASSNWKLSIDDPDNVYSGESVITINGLAAGAKVRKSWTLTPTKVDYAEQPVVFSLSNGDMPISSGDWTYVTP